MAVSEHPYSPEDFVAGRLSDQANAAMLEHLAVCERCASDLERLWSQSDLLQSFPTIADPGVETLAQLERSLFRRIHASELGGQVVQFGTQRFLGFLVKLLDPLIASMRSTK